jgi:hypothetical protein
VVILIAWLLQTAVDGRSVSEYQLKAAFLYNFAQFVEWPPDALGDSRRPIIIGVLGDDPFGSALDEITRGKSVSGRRIVVKRFRHVKDIDACHILFISDSEEDREQKDMQSLAGSSILTVGETDDFIRHGGIIRFTMENSKIGLEINIDHARSARLKISSKLLKLARIVK